jgi:hypothetical protein
MTAMIATTAATPAQAVAAGLLTAAQTALDVAPTANPIGIVVVAWAGLVAALITAHDTSSNLRAIVDGVFADMAEAVREAIADFNGLATASRRRSRARSTRRIVPCVAASTAEHWEHRGDGGLAHTPPSMPHQAPCAAQPPWHGTCRKCN